MLKTSTFLIVFSLLICFKSNAQSITNYGFAGAYAPGSFVPLSGAVSPSLTAGNADDGYFNGIPIGFDFFFMGVRYTSLSVSTNGWVSLGSNITDSQPTNNMTSGAPKPIIAPLWDDLTLQTSANFSFLSSGTVGTRVLTLQWLNARWAKTATQPTISFQVKLYESTGVIEFFYRPEAGTLVGGESASIGIASSSGMQSLNGFGGSLLLPALYFQPVVSTTETATIAARASYELRFTFSPPNLTPTAFLGNPTPTAFATSNITTNSARISWTDNSNNEVAFAIYRSTDNVSFNYLGQTIANTNFFDVAGLVSGITYYFRVYALTEGRLSTALSGSLTTTCISPGTWTGRTNSSWTTASNWCGGAVPTAATDVLIQSGAFNFPIVSTATPTARNVVIQSGASLTVTGQLQITGAISNSGTFQVSSGTIAMNGSTAQVIPANVFSANTINNLTIANSSGVSLAGALRLTGTLTPSAGIFATNGLLTLSSSVSSSAQVAAIPASAGVSGSVTVERYIQGGPVSPWRTYRMLSSPVYDNSASLITSGVRTYALGQFLDDMHITGGSGAADGFDPSPQNAPSAFYYTSSGYTAFTNSTATTNVGSGIYLFYRGNRSNPSTKLYSPFSNPESQVMTFKGVLNQQDVSVPLFYGTVGSQSGFNLVGNPYAATIDWNSPNFGKTNVGSTIWIWNPANRNYATYNGAAGVNGGSQYISSGQSFFVKANSAGGHITFRESIKAPTQQPPILLMSSPSPNVVASDFTSADAVVPSLGYSSTVPEIRIKMTKPASYNADETVVLLADGATGAFTEEDAMHLDGEGVFLSTLSTDQVKLAINKMPGIAQFREAAVFANASTTGNYSFFFALNNWVEGSKLELVDQFLSQTVEIQSEYIHSFDIDKNNVASFGGSRFLLKYTPPGTLPLANAAFSAAVVNAEVVLRWDLQNPKLGYTYYVEKRLSDSKQLILSSVTKINELSYRIIDRQPISGANYYRLAEKDANGIVNYSEWKSVNFGFAAQMEVVLYPNPAIDFFKLSYAKVDEEKSYLLRIDNLMGQKVKEVSIKGNEINETSIGVSDFPSGGYIVSLQEADTRKKIGFVKLMKN